MVMNASQFLEQYRHDIAALPVFGSTAGGSADVSSAAYLQNLHTDEKRVFITLLPQAAAFRHRRPELAAPELIETVKSYCVNEIDKVLNSGLLESL